MAEALLRAKLTEQNRGLVVYSAGLGALIGEPAHATAVKLMAQKGIDISQHRASQLNHEMIRASDLLLVMESVHQIEIESRDRTARGKIFRLGHWDGTDIADPFGQSEQAFETVLKVIERGVDRWVEKLSPLRTGARGSVD